MAIKTYTDDNQNLKLVDNVQTTPRTLDELSKGSNSAHASRHNQGGADEISIENFNEVATGWMPANETWTYVSADDPIFTFTISGDKTSKYSAGMKIKLTQTTGGTKYFIITAVSYSDPNTTITIYGGTDYNLENEAISNPYYSVVKAPVGFLLDTDKWTVKVTDSTRRRQDSPTANAWYNLGSVSISIPIGIWEVSYSVVGLVAKNNGIGSGTIFVTLSTSNNSESDNEFTTLGYKGHSTSTYQDLNVTLFATKSLNLTSKTTYYINTKTDAGDVIANMNDTKKLVIRAICAYL